MNKVMYSMTSVAALTALAYVLPAAPHNERASAATDGDSERAARKVVASGRCREPHQGTREMQRRRKRRARAGLPIVEPQPVDLAACVGIDEEIV